MRLRRRASLPSCAGSHRGNAAGRSEPESYSYGRLNLLPCFLRLKAAVKRTEKKTQRQRKHRGPCRLRCNYRIKKLCKTRVIIDYEGEEKFEHAAGKNRQKTDEHHIEYASAQNINKNQARADAKRHTKKRVETENGFSGAIA